MYGKSSELYKYERAKMKNQLIVETFEMHILYKEKNTNKWGKS